MLKRRFFVLVHNLWLIVATNLTLKWYAGNQYSKLLVWITICSPDGYVDDVRSWLIDDPQGPFWFRHKNCILRSIFLEYVFFSWELFLEAINLGTISWSYKSWQLMTLIQIVRGMLWIYCSKHRVTWNFVQRMYWLAYHQMLSMLT